jgi:hypothetical protein
MLVAVRLFLGGGNDWYPELLLKLVERLAVRGYWTSVSPQHSLCVLIRFFPLSLEPVCVLRDTVNRQFSGFCGGRTRDSKASRSLSPI